jgi:hypothetical protein
METAMPLIVYNIIVLIEYKKSQRERYIYFVTS